MNNPADAPTTDDCRIAIMWWAFCHIALPVAISAIIAIVWMRIFP
jgi:hypothetical protein